ncbi:hypothetical protein SLA2020_332130 [Shorea laevis]
MGSSKIIPSTSLAFHKALSLSPSSSHSQSARTGKLPASLTHANKTSATSNLKSFLPNPPSLHQFLTKQCKSGAISLNKAVHFFDYMIHMHPMPPISSFNHLLGTLAKIKLHNQVLSLYRRFDSIGILPDIMTLNIMLNCCCKTGRVSYAFSVLGKILMGGYSPAVFTFNTLIKGVV